MNKAALITICLSMLGSIELFAADIPLANEKTSLGDLAIVVSLPDGGATHPIDLIEGAGMSIDFPPANSESTGPENGASGSIHLLENEIKITVGATVVF